jgi:hypothetical protein
MMRRTSPRCARSMRPSETRFITARGENWAEYSEANMGSGEARLYVFGYDLRVCPPEEFGAHRGTRDIASPCAQYELGKYLWMCRCGAASR